MAPRRLDLPRDREVRASANSGVNLVAVEPAALARRDSRAVAPARVRVGVALALGAVLREVALTVRVDGQVGSVDGEVAAELGLLGAEPIQDPRDAGVEQIGVGAELRREAVASPMARRFARASDCLSQRVMLADQGDGAGPRRDAVDRLGERHAHHRAERVAGTAGPPRLLKLSDESPDLRGVEESCNLGRRRARWYLRTVHGASLSVGQTPGRANAAGVTFSAIRESSYGPRRTEKPSWERAK